MHVQANRLHEQFCADIQPDAGGDVYWIYACGFEVRLPLTFPGVIGPLLNTNNMSTTKIVGEVDLSSSNAFGATNCSQLFEPAAHETGRCFCRWCDKMFRSAANRARHERLLP